MGSRRRGDLDPQDRRSDRERLRAGRQDRPGARRLNVAFLDSWLRDRAAGSGSAVAIEGLRRGLTSLGHDVEVLRPERTFGSLSLTRLAFNLAIPRRLARSGSRYDLVVGFDIDGFLVDPTKTPRYVVALKGIAAEELRFETGPARWRMAILSGLERRNVRRARRVYVTSDYQAEAARTHYDVDPAKLRVVPEALDEEIRARAAAARAARGERPGADGHPVILSVARQYRRKDTATLLRAFALLGASSEGAGRGARLRVVGDGPELGPAIRLAGELGIQGRVTFTGALSSAEALDREYRSADVFCLPSQQEGFGIVFLEAMAYGLPIVAARAAAVPEVAPDGRVSLLVEPGSAPDLARALDRILTDRPLAERLGIAGVERAAAFTWTATARAFLDGLA